MAPVNIFWDPNGFELDSLGRSEHIRNADGDTPYVSMSIRMLSIDTPEVHYPGNAKPSRQDENLQQLAEWIEQGKAPIDDSLAAHIQPKIQTGQAGTLQETQGKKASEQFDMLVDKKLAKDNGKKRPLFLRAANEHFDSFGRLLAYVAPRYSRKELDNMLPIERATFNLLMVESGWAAPFPIYPSLPRHSDLLLLHDVAEQAVTQKKGAWADDLTLTGYEFRMVVKLFKVTEKLVKEEKLSSKEKYSWISRFCFDMTTLEIVYPQDYYMIPVYNRVFVWPKDVNESAGRLNLVPKNN